MSCIIYYVGADLYPDSAYELGFSPYNKLHVTIAYSRTWFPYKPNRLRTYPIILYPPFTNDTFGENLYVLRFNNETIVKYHRRHITNGATWDYPEYNPHITIPEPIPQDKLDSITHLGLLREYYETWLES